MSSVDPTEMHGIFLLNHVLPQLVLGAFTQNFYFGAFLQIIINIMLFNVVLPPRPLPFDFLVELNLIFVAAQLGGTLAGTAVAQAVGVPPILEVTLPWEVKYHHRAGRYVWSYPAWLRAAFTTIMLTAITGALYDFGVSVWTPGNFALWGLVVSGILLVILYPIAFAILSLDVGPRRPFVTRAHLRDFLLLLGGVQLVFINVWWPFNTLFQRATQLGWVMLGLLVLALLTALLVAIFRLPQHRARVYVEK